MCWPILANEGWAQPSNAQVSRCIGVSTLCGLWDRSNLKQSGVGLGESIEMHGKLEGVNRLYTFSLFSFAI
jgi:hypothetical protein